jgi:hypothetical protein
MEVERLMRKLREAALVAATVGSVSMLGAGVASAQGGGGGEQPRSVTINCDQDASDSTSTSQISGGLITITGPLIVAGGDAPATQQICGIDNDHNSVDSGDSASGSGTELL